MTAAVWGLLCVGTILYFNSSQEVLDSKDVGVTKQPAAGAGAGGAKDEGKKDESESK